MRVLVLSSGNARGAYHVGVLKHILGDLETKYDAICGVSVGSINAAHLAMYPIGKEKQCIKDLEQIWAELTTANIYKRWHPFGKLHCLKNKPSLYDSSPLKKTIDKNIDPDRIKNSGKKLRIGAVSITTGKYKLFHENYHDLLTAILASSAFPFAFCPIEMDGQWWADGGMRVLTPLKSAIKLGPSQIDIIATSPRISANYIPKVPNIIDMGPRYIDVMSDGIMTTDIDRLLETNKRLEGGEEIPGKNIIEARVFMPKSSLTDSSFNFEQDNIQPMIRQGYIDAMEVTGMS